MINDYRALASITHPNPTDLIPPDNIMTGAMLTIVPVVSSVI